MSWTLVGRSLVARWSLVGRLLVVCWLMMGCLLMAETCNTLRVSDV